VRVEIRRRQLAEIVDEVIPFGSIMAGTSNAPWRRTRDAPPGDPMD
jgi:hypothetical protein